MAIVFIYEQRPYKTWIKSFTTGKLDIEVEHCDDEYESVGSNVYEYAELILSTPEEEEEVGREV